MDKDPSLAYAWCMLGAAQRGVERWDESIANSEKAIAKEDLSYGYACSQLGAAYHNLQQFAEAVTCFEKAIWLGLTAGSEQEALKHLELAREYVRVQAEAQRTASASTGSAAGTTRPA